jgi:hypothetical protein
LICCLKISLKRNSRPQQIDHHSNDQYAQIQHRAAALPDSRSTASWMGFAAGTASRMAFATGTPQRRQQRDRVEVYGILSRPTTGLAIGLPAALAPSPQLRPAPTGRALPLCRMHGFKRKRELRRNWSLLQLGVLVGQNLQTTGLGHVEPAVPALPRRTADPLIPCLRQTSPVFDPVSCSRRIAMIRSSVNLDCLISVSLQVTDSTHFWRKFWGSGQIVQMSCASKIVRSRTQELMTSC